MRNAPQTCPVRFEAPFDLSAADTVLFRPRDFSQQWRLRSGRSFRFPMVM